MLELTMRRMKAGELIEDPDYASRLTIDGFYSLLIEAGYSEEVAQKAVNDRGMRRLAAGEKM